MKNLIYLFVAILVVSGCSKDDEVPVDFRGVFGFDDYQKAREQLKNYVIFGTYTDGVAKLLLEKEEDSFVGEVFAKYRAEVDEPRTNGGDFFIGGIKCIGEEDGRYLVQGDTPNGSEQMGDKLKEYFGSDVQFSLHRDGETIFNETIHLPEEFEITNMNTLGHYEMSNYNLITRNDFSYTWNEDSNNDNGVLAVMTWNGDTVDASMDELGGSDITYKAAWFGDTGSALVPESFFEEIPKGAIVRISFMRAYFEVIKGLDNREYKIYGMTQEAHSFVLEN